MINNIWRFLFGLTTYTMSEHVRWNLLQHLQITIPLPTLSPCKYSEFMSSDIRLCIKFLDVGNLNWWTSLHLQWVSDIIRKHFFHIKKFNYILNVHVRRAQLSCHVRNFAINWITEKFTSPMNINCRWKFVCNWHELFTQSISSFPSVVCMCVNTIIGWQLTSSGQLCVQHYLPMKEC